MNHFQSGAMVNEVAEDVLVLRDFLWADLSSVNARGGEGSLGWRAAACSALKMRARQFSEWLFFFPLPGNA